MNQKQKKGFTLIEMLAVVTILAILTAIALPQYRRSIERTRVAEALSLMRSIYDSCERLAIEKGYNDCFTAVNDSKVNFKNMDIQVKGTYGLSEDGELPFALLTTENFKYDLQYLGTDDEKVFKATAVKGDYKGAWIKFNGYQFSCGNGTSDKDACSAWGSSQWNQ